MGEMAKSMSTQSLLMKFSRIIGFISSRFGDLCCILLLFMAALVTWDVFMRYAFKKPSFWADEVSEYTLAAIASLGFCYTLKLRRHISVDIIVERMPRRVKNYLSIATSILSFLCFVILAVLSFQLWWEAILIGQTTYTTLAVPFAFLYGYVFVGMLMLVLQSLSNIFADIIQVDMKTD
jgi:TRAP-type C4-dicarboxylate transport system permease small subunit